MIAAVSQVRGKFNIYELEVETSATGASHINAQELKHKSHRQKLLHAYEENEVLLLMCNILLNN